MSVHLLPVLLNLRDKRRGEHGSCRYSLLNVDKNRKSTLGDDRIYRRSFLPKHGPTNFDAQVQSNLDLRGLTQSSATRVYDRFGPNRQANGGGSEYR